MAYDEEAIYQTETDSAVCVEIDGEDFWIPDSHIESDSDIYLGCGLERGAVATIVMSDWIAKRKGLL